MFHNAFRQFTRLACAICIGLVCILSAHAQVTTGNVRGIVEDPNGAAVPNAKVTITNPATNATETTQTTAEGEYQFNNLLVGTYAMTIEATGFKTTNINDVRVELNKTTDIPPARLEVGTVGGDTVTITAGGAELVDTTTTNLSRQFDQRQVVELAQTSMANGLGVYNLALISPNVTSSGGVGVGMGGSVGGQRPRNNDFVVDGIDNNDKSVTGPQVYISPEAIAEFSLLTNQYSAEFARSTGGQFIVATASGTDKYHGSAYGFMQNRKLNALDNQQILQGITRATNPRYDFDRFGGKLGGPVPGTGLSKKLFFFGMFEEFHTGQSTPPGGILAPTAAGFGIINSDATNFSPTNLGIFNQYIPVAPANDAGTIPLGLPCAQGSNAFCTNVAPTGRPAVYQQFVPVGNVAIPAPFYDNNRFVQVNFDYNQSSKTLYHSRFTYDRFRQIDNAATLPVFYVAIPQDSRLFSFTAIHNFSANVTNETRLAYRRFHQVFPVGGQVYPGLDQFPNIGLNDIGINIGPDPSAPQFRIENNYQIVDNVSYLSGNHSTKFGGDFRVLVAPATFVQRARGDYEYNSTNEFLTDISPEFAERNVGANTYYGNQKLLFLFAQDDWRFRPNLTINLGVNYVYQQVPLGAREQNLNQIASVPGLISFNSPTSQKKNFGPRIGVAYSPNYQSGYLGKLFGSNGKTSIRAGFSMAYDVIFDNLYISSSPPQFQQTIDVGPGIPNFLATGGIPNVIQPAGTDVAAARAATSAFIPDQQVPYAITFTGSIQRQFLKNYAIEFRYIHDRGVHLLTQNRINRQSKVFNGPGGFLPTFLSMPSPAQLDALTTTLADIQARSNFVPAYAAAGFASNITAFLSNGNSVYDGGSVQLQRRFSNGLQFSAAYTLSHMIDDTTAEVFSTLLSPRRVQDFQNLRGERADSALDHRNRFVFSSIYTLPFFRKSSNFLTRTMLGGLSFAGTLSLETGEKATVRSGIDSNLNGDNAGDRAIINVNGMPGTDSAVTAINAAGQTVKIGDPTTVAYIANTPNAQYIQAGLGALANAGRNTLQLPGIRNVDFSIFKNFNFSETKRIQLRADLYNAFNHPQYVPGSVNGGEAVTQTSPAVQALLQTGLNETFFNRPDMVFTSHPRQIQLALRFDF